MKIRASTRKLFKETPEAYRVNFLFEVLEYKNSAKRKATDTFDEIMKRLEDGERHNSRGMKELKRKLDKWIASFSKHSTLFMEWGELTEAGGGEQSGKRQVTNITTGGNHNEHRQQVGNSELFQWHLDRAGAIRTSHRAQQDAYALFSGKPG